MNILFTSSGRRVELLKRAKSTLLPKYIKSSSNFILLTPNKNGAECPEIAAEFAAFLRSKKILARYFASDPSVNMSIRLTIGTPEQMQTVMDAITQWTNI